MTLEERLAIIEKKANMKNAEEDKKKTELQNKTQKALREIQDLTPRIKALLTLANKCIQERIKFPSSSETKKYGYGNGYNSYNFLADGIYHHVGFMGRSDTKEIKYLGIYNGDFFGVWDFYTDGENTFVKHERDESIKIEVPLDHLNIFLEEFDLFEESFYKWIDSME